MVNKGITMKSYIKSEKFYGIAGSSPTKMKRKV